MSGNLIRRTVVGALLLLLTTGPSLPGAQSSPWLTADGQATAATHQALRLLQNAFEEGLAPTAYRAAELSARAAPLMPGDPDSASRFEADLTAAMSQYLHDVHEGRIDPRRLGFQLDLPSDNHDFRSLVLDAAAGGRLEELVAVFRPPYRQYQQLVSVLARYRAATAASADLLPPEVRLPIRPGDRSTGVDWMRARLATLGDLASSASSDRDLYDDELVSGVRRFQQRHGLVADGVVGAATFAAMRVPLADRITQVELALERLRWLPHQRHSRVVVINIPMFELWGWSGSPATTNPDVRTGVIVGRALSTETPVMAQAIQEVIFRPYWNVPRSIVQQEIRPAMAVNPDYLVDNDMELVQGDGDRSPVVEASLENLERLWRGEVRVRQRPGPRNALGLVKFVFPNDEQVYMHGTPAQSLFSRTRRDFSHGCVRVQDPVALAEWVLAREEGWTRERILAAMADASGPMTVRLTEPVDVLLFYTTAVALADGSVRFGDDIYGHDARLKRALAYALR